MSLNGLVQILGPGSPGGAGGRKVYAPARLAKLYQQLKAKESADYRITTLTRTLQSLASSPHSSRSINSSATLQTITRR